MELLEGRIYVLQREETVWPASANLLLLKDDDGAVLVDAGCGRKEDYRVLLDFLSRHGLGIFDVHTVVLTHVHPDHAGAVAFILRETRPRIFLHPAESPLGNDPSLLNDTFDIDLPYRCGTAGAKAGGEKADILEYFRSLCPITRVEATDLLPHDTEVELAGLRFRIILTPGHAPGLVSLFQPEKGILFSTDAVGDVVAWYSPSSGGVTGFLEGLDRLSRLPARILVPSHGKVSGDPHAKIEAIRKKLLRREKRIMEEVSRGPLPFPELVSRIFRNPLFSFFPGPQITWSHLDKLEAEGKVRRRAEDVPVVEATTP